MALTYNDLTTRAWTSVTVTGGTDIDDATSGAVPVRVMAMNVAVGDAAGRAAIGDAATSGSAIVARLEGLADDNVFMNWGPTGLRLTTGLSVNVVTSDRVTVWYVLEDE